MTTATAARPTGRSPTVAVPTAAVAAMLVATILFDPFSLASLPGTLGRQFSKIVEVAVMGLLAWLAIADRWLPRPNLPILLAGLFVVTALLSGFWAVEEAPYRSGISTLLRSSSSAFVIYLAMQSRRDVEQFLVVLKVVSVGVAALVLIEIYRPGFSVAELLGQPRNKVSGIFQVEEGLDQGFVRARGPMGHPNYMGYFFGVTLMLTPYLWLRYPTRRARMWLVGSTLCELFALVLGYVRLGVVGVLVGGAWFFARGAIRHRVLTLMAMVVVGVVVFPFLPEGFQHRVANPEEWQTDRSIASRYSQQLSNLDLAVAYGGVGVGYGGYGPLFFEEGTGLMVELFRQQQVWFGEDLKIENLGSHNSYLEIVIELGIVGIVFWVGISLALLHGLLEAGARHRGDPAMVQLVIGFEAMIASMVVMNGVLHTQETRIQWVVFGLASAFISLSRHGLIGSSAGDVATSWVLPAEERVLGPLRLGLFVLCLAVVAVTAAIWAV